MEVQVDIVVQTITARYGTLNPGDTLRTDAAYAEHLVNDCRAAAYRKPPVKPEPSAAVEVLLPDLTASAEIDVETSAQVDPYSHLGTLIAVVPGTAASPTDAEHSTDSAADDAVQTSAQPGMVPSAVDMPTAGNAKRKRSSASETEG